MGDAFDAALQQGLSELGLLETESASAQARASYEAHARLLTAWGAAINLTAIRDAAGIATRHVCDSLSAAPRLSEVGATGGTLLDLGSGGGYPGLPLAAALRLRRVVLLDSVRKKARFLDVAGAAVAKLLRDENGAHPVIASIAERAEDVAGDPERRETWDVVTARAVGPLSEVMELALPLTREGGHVVAWKRDGAESDLLGELRDAGPIIGRTGGGRPDVLGIPGEGFRDHRLVIVRKERPAPRSYPRAAGVRKRGRR
jgi:16S rRNA (guanine527-N7)-methyltransferase